MSTNYPSEFHRRPRQLGEWCDFKATEFRQFLLYGSELFIEKHIGSQALRCWHMLTLGMRILADPRYYAEPDMNALAHSLLVSYIHTSAEYYGNHFVSMVVHQLSHLAAECRRNGPIDVFSGFKYENMNKTLKNLCHTYKNPVQNITKKLKYKSGFISKACRNLPDPTVSYPHLANEIRERDEDMTEDRRYYKAIRFEHFYVNTETTGGNCYVYVHQPSTNVYLFFQVAVISADADGRNIQMLCNRLTTTSSAYEVIVDRTPIGSSLVGVFSVSGTSGTHMIRPEAVCGKAVYIETNKNRKVIYPMLNLCY